MGLKLKPPADALASGLGILLGAVFGGIVLSKACYYGTYSAVPCFLYLGLEPIDLAFEWKAY